MAERLEFIVEGEPAPRPRPRNRVVRTRGGGAFAKTYHPDTTNLDAKRPEDRAWARANLWHQAVLAAARRAPGFPSEPWDGPVRVTIRAYFERPGRLLKKSAPAGPVRMNCSPDADNITKAVLDALTPPRPKKATNNDAIKAVLRLGYLWINDGQVHMGPVDRWYAAKDCGPGVIITAERIEGEAGGSFDTEVIMLVLTRKTGESVIVGDPGKPMGMVRVVSVGIGQVRLAFDFPRELPVNRTEIAAEKAAMAPREPRT